MTNKTKKIAILQSNYLPWKGVFDMIHQVDEFVFLEDVQYTEHDWRNRNKIKTSNGLKWIVVPVKNSSRRGQLICEAEIDNRSNWQRKHLNAFQMSYSRAPFYKEYKWILEDILLGQKWEKISELNIYAIKVIAKVLGIETRYTLSTDLDINDAVKDDRIIEICKKLGGNYYLSGPAARDYIVPQKFVDNNIELHYIQYHYPEYAQLYGDFEHGVSVLDVIFNCGPKAGQYILGDR